MGDVVLVSRFANDLEAQAAAAALRSAGLHPVVLARDPLAQLFQPFHAARLLVPEEEREAARELLESLTPEAPEPAGLQEEARARGAQPLRALGLLGAWGILLLAPVVAPARVWIPLLLSLAALALLRWGAGAKR